MIDPALSHAVGKTATIQFMSERRYVYIVLTLYIAITKDHIARQIDIDSSAYSRNVLLMPDQIRSIHSTVMPVAYVA